MHICLNEGDRASALRLVMYLMHHIVPGAFTVCDVHTPQVVFMSLSICIVASHYPCCVCLVSMYVL